MPRSRADTRLDRDLFVEIHFDNIAAGEENNFDKISTDDESGDLFAYNFGSIMHYGPFDFAADPSKPTITVRPGITLPPGVVMGQRTGLSLGDINAINLLYCVRLALGGALCN